MLSETEDPLFFKYGIIYYRVQKYNLYLTNKEEEFQKVLVEKGEAVIAIEIFPNQESVVEFKKN